MGLSDRDDLEPIPLNLSIYSFSNLFLISVVVDQKVKKKQNKKHESSLWKKQQRISWNIVLNYLPLCSKHVISVCSIWLKSSF